MTTDFEMFSGDDKILTVTVLDTAGSAVDITGATAKWWLARSVNSSANITKATGGSGISITDAANGVLQITLEPSDTDDLSGSFYHELEITDASSNISTVLAGNALIKKDLIV